MMHTQHWISPQRYSDVLGSTFASRDTILEEKNRFVSPLILVTVLCAQNIVIEHISTDKAGTFQEHTSQVKCHAGILDSLKIKPPRHAPLTAINQGIHFRFPRWLLLIETVQQLKTEGPKRALTRCRVGE